MKLINRGDRGLMIEDRGSEIDEDTIFYLQSSILDHQSLIPAVEIFTD